jgi:hypothetical protein
MTNRQRKPLCSKDGLGCLSVVRQQVIASDSRTGRVADVFGRKWVIANRRSVTCE